MLAFIFLQLIFEEPHAISSSSLFYSVRFILLTYLLWIHNLSERSCIHLQVQAPPPCPNFKIGQASQMACCTRHSIVPLLGSFHDLLAFASTCCPGVLPSPPSHLNPHCTYSSPLFSSNLMSLSAPLALFQMLPEAPLYPNASQDTLLCSHIPLLPIDYGNNRPPIALDKFAFRGASFGHMIFSSSRSCFVFDVFTGIDVSPPLLPVDEYTEIYYGAALTAPLSSPNSHLIVYTASSNFFWHVSSNSWLKHSPRSGTLDKFVVFKGQVFGMGSDPRLFMVHLTPRIRLQKLPVFWGGKNSMTKYEDHCSTHTNSRENWINTETRSRFGAARLAAFLNSIANMKIITTGC